MYKLSRLTERRYTLTNALINSVAIKSCLLLISLIINLCLLSAVLAYPF